jgi:hypothetical protein
MDSPWTEQPAGHAAPALLQPATDHPSHPSFVLRSSCDACSAAKVRCDKTRPHCLRCRAGSVRCVYGISRKHRGHRDSARHHHHHQATKADLILPRVPAPLSSSSTMRGQHEQSPSGGSVAAVQFLTPISPESIQAADDRERRRRPSFLAHDKHAFMPCQISVDLDPDPSAEWTAMRCRSAMAGSGGGSVGGTAHDAQLPLTTTPGDLNGFLLPLDGAVTDWSSMLFGPPVTTPPASTASDAHDCFALAIATLDSLRCDPTQVPLTLDQVLRGNKASSAVVSGLLACPCAVEPHLAMLYGSIVAKILLRYRLAGSMLRRGPSQLRNSITPPAGASASPSSPSASQTAPFGPLPDAIGTFELDADDRARLGRQLLCSELRKAGALIDTFVAAGPDVAERSTMLYATLGGWLRREWTLAMREPKQAMPLGDAEGEGEDQEEPDSR